VVAWITPVGPDLNTGSLTLITYRAIAFYMRGLLFHIHGDWLMGTLKRMSVVPVFATMYLKSVLPIILVIAC
jgi:hypothetical protein